jgi:hypothetical protein
VTRFRGNQLHIAGHWFTYQALPFVEAHCSPITNAIKGVEGRDFAPHDPSPNAKSAFRHEELQNHRSAWKHSRRRLDERPAVANVHEYHITARSQANAEPRPFTRGSAR